MLINKLFVLYLRYVAYAIFTWMIFTCFVRFVALEFIIWPKHVQMKQIKLQLIEVSSLQEIKIIQSNNILDMNPFRLFIFGRIKQSRKIILLHTIWRVPIYLFNLIHFSKQYNIYFKIPNKNWFDYCIFTNLHFFFREILSFFPPLLCL